MSGSNSKGTRNWQGEKYWHNTKIILLGSWVEDVLLPRSVWVHHWPQNWSRYRDTTPRTPQLFLLWDLPVTSYPKHRCPRLFPRAFSWPAWEAGQKFWAWNTLWQYFAVTKEWGWKQEYPRFLTHLPSFPVKMEGQVWVALTDSCMCLPGLLLLHSLSLPCDSADASWKTTWSWSQGRFPDLTLGRLNPRRNEASQRPRPNCPHYTPDSLLSKVLSGIDRTELWGNGNRLSWFLPPPALPASL